MEKQCVFLTGATGGMGFECLKQMMEDTEFQDLIILVRDSKKNHILLRDFEEKKGLTIYWGDLTNYEDVYECVKKADIILHVAAFVSPAADYFPQEAMSINYGSTKNIIDSINSLNRQDTVKLVYIGTIAETGDRMPPIHWGRIGDPIKPSIYDYYAVSKVAAERLLIEAGIKYWVSLRQTGILSQAMSKIRDAIIFHNCLDNVLEFVSVRDSGRLLKNLCNYQGNGKLSDNFWGHIYNVGGGEACRVSTYEFYRDMYKAMGLTKLEYILNPKDYATRNFHGQYYLDSDILEDYLHFRNDGMQYYYNEYIKGLGISAYGIKILCRLPGGQKLIGNTIKKMFDKLAKNEHGTMYFIKNNMEEHIDAYWGSRKNWDCLPEDINKMEHFKDWDKVILLNHGYDETKPESQLNLKDMKQAAEYRGGELISDFMNTGDWQEKLRFRCAFGHEFEASPKLVLEGGHWCEECERKSWNYGERAKKDPFFAQVWEPLHQGEKAREYLKEVTELNYENKF